MPPGPVVGEALDFLLEVRLDEGPITEEEAYRRLRKWADERGYLTGRRGSATAARTTPT